MTATSPARARDATAPESHLTPPADMMVTGEAVALELRPASVVNRILGGLVDLAIYGMLGLVTIVLLLRFVFAEQTNIDARMSIAAVITAVSFMVVLPTVIETLSRGLSAGKLAVGLRVVRDDGGAVRFRQSLVRAVVGIPEIWLTGGGLAVISGIFNKRSKRLGDLLAGTYAVQVRGTEQALAPLLMPPELAGWSSIADIRRLPDRIAFQARIFLSRTGSLNAQTRAELGRQFAATLEPYVSPPPPWGTHPERFIAAVLVTRRDREYRSALVAQRQDATTRERIRQLPFGITDS
ncbi:MAG: RDD family protein [Beutenbergiaceae bacterium]